MGFLHSLRILSASNVLVVERNLSKEGDEFPLFFLSYTENLKKLEDFLLTAEDRKGIIFMHQGVSGTPMGSGFVLNELLNASMIPLDTRMTFTGHYHERKIVSPNLQVVGNLNHLTWGDAGSVKGFLDVEVSETGVSVTQIPTKAPYFKTLKYEQLEFQPQVEDGWIKVIGKYKELKNVLDDVREALLKEGARSVEFDLEDETTSKENVNDTYSKEDGFDLNRISEEYGNQAPDDFTRQVGRSLRS